LLGWDAQHMPMHADHQPTTRPQHLAQRGEARGTVLEHGVVDRDRRVRGRYRAAAASAAPSRTSTTRP
jgi:hypothetical protein